MAETEKLYPPIVGGSIPACYNDHGTVLITVPFSMNRAVGIADVKGFRLKIKTVQSNTYLKTLEVTTATADVAIGERQVTFQWTNFNNAVVIGQYLKVQLAYVNQSDVVGYYSTPSIVKFTAQPTIYIAGLGSNNTEIDTFKSSFTGVYLPNEDKSERPYSYIFNLYDTNNELLETSGWLLHNNTINPTNSFSASLETSIDTYAFSYAAQIGDTYSVEYGVRTINNLESFSPLYTCLDVPVLNSNFHMDLVATNNFEEAYIALNLSKNHNYLNAELSNPVSIEICRAEKTDNYASWVTLQRLYFSSYGLALKWVYKDFTIEQGISYIYCFRQYNENNVYSARTLSNEVTADFEDMFLWDGERQLKIRFNPKVSSFKNTRLEQKIDTIGSRYPFIFRNGIVNYKEFPIAGLISYLADNNEMFINHVEDLNIVLPEDCYLPSDEYVYRYIEMPENTILNNDDLIYYQDASGDWDSVTYAEKENDVIYYLREQIQVMRAREKTPSAREVYKNTITLDSVGYNMRAERRFKMQLLEWLGNGKIKMFKSAAEGNYLVRLMNVSLTPEDKLGRMLHSFSATAYEVEELTYKNLVSLGFIKADELTVTSMQTQSILLRQKIEEITGANVSIKLNTNVIRDVLIVDTSNNTNSSSFTVRIGLNSTEHAWIINSGLEVHMPNAILQDVYFNLIDNLEQLQVINPNLTATSSLDDLKAAAITLVADTVMTYNYYLTEVMSGDIYDNAYRVSRIYASNVVKTINGPASITQVLEDTPQRHKEILRFFVLNFMQKPIITLYTDGTSYFADMALNQPIRYYDRLSLYQINGSNVVYMPTSDTELQPLINENALDRTLHLRDINGTDIAPVDFSAIPALNLSNLFDVYSMLTIGNGLYIECAYQELTTEYGEE